MRRHGPCQRNAENFSEDAVFDRQNKVQGRRDGKSKVDRVVRMRRQLSAVSL